MSSEEDRVLRAIDSVAGKVDRMQETAADSRAKRERWEGRTEQQLDTVTVDLAEVKTEVKDLTGDLGRRVGILEQGRTMVVRILTGAMVLGGVAAAWFGGLVNLFKSSGGGSP